METIDGIFFLNPGSLMFNRGSYGYGTFALFTIYDDGHFDYHFLHHETFEDVTDVVLPDGIELLADLKKYLK